MNDIATIADQGDRLATLKALRHKLAETIDNSHSGRDIAALARQLQIVSGQIAEIEAQQSDDPISDILKEHEDRGDKRTVRRSMLHDPIDDNSDD